MQRAIAAAEYQASETERGLQAPNRAHGLRTWFAPTGIRIHDRRIAGRSGLAELSLVGIGRGSMLAPVAAGRVTETASRVEIRRPGIVEWYENSPRGLEQGFTLQARSQGEGSLVLELSVAHARAIVDGASVVLISEAGRRLRYGDLFAEDAEGRLIASRIEVANPHLLRLLVEDAGAVYPIVIDPLITAISDATLESNIAWSGSFDSTSFGESVSGAGDVNGDGFDDIVIGAFGYDNGLFDEGAAFVFLGSANGIVGSDPSTANAVLLGDNASGEFGNSVSGAGDVNGDGYDDIVIGAHHYDSTIAGGTLAVDGAAFVFHGSATGITGTGPSTADASIFGNQIDCRLGHAVASAGDVNGDGRGDIIVGAPLVGIPFPSPIPENQGSGNGGAALIFLGSAAGITGTGFADADRVIFSYPPGQPVASGDQIGADVAAAGNVNNDLYDDVLVGAGGYIMVFHGSASGITGTDPSNADTKITSSATISVGALVRGFRSAPQELSCAFRSRCPPAARE
ncbi:MAG: FG-GAP repeat protein [Proteobacteria bacterium]|nr:FG-GAP repeat protein [Pseudomonadota bacterium]